MVKQQCGCEAQQASVMCDSRTDHRLALHYNDSVAFTIHAGEGCKWTSPQNLNMSRVDWGYA